MNLKFYFLITGLCLSLGACTTSQTKSSAVPQTTGSINTATASDNGPLETFMQGCNIELETYCKDVMPGDGRVIACIYAHEDKLSGRCENALYDSAQQLEDAVAALTYLATECDADIEKHCANIEPGEGRIMDCMEPHLKTVSKRCQKAMQEVGLEK
jgi:hypothetical protein